MSDIDLENFRNKVESLIRVIFRLRSILECESEVTEMDQPKIFTETDFKIYRQQLIWADEKRARYLIKAEENGLLKEECMARLHAA